MYYNSHGYQLTWQKTHSSFITYNDLDTYLDILSTYKSKFRIIRAHNNIYIHYNNQYALKDRTFMRVHSYNIS